MSPELDLMAIDMQEKVERSSAISSPANRAFMVLRRKGRRPDLG
jgi:hypothetical protein